jgi:hypothetical protein
MTEPESIDERIARSIHARYHAAFGAGITVIPWEDLRADQRRQAISQARDIPDKLAVAGWRIAAAGSPVQEDCRFRFDPDDIETLARREHERWQCTQRARGFESGPRNEPARQHPNLAPWGTLEEPTKEKDRHAVEQIPELLEEVGLVAMRNPLTIRVGLVADLAEHDPEAMLAALAAACTRTRNRIPVWNAVAFELVLMVTRTDASSIELDQFDDLIARLGKGTHLGKGTWVRAHLLSDRWTGTEDTGPIFVEVRSYAVDLGDLAVATEAISVRRAEIVEALYGIVVERENVARGVYPTASERWARLAEAVADEADVVVVMDGAAATRGETRRALQYSRHRGYRTSHARRDGRWRRRGPVSPTDFEIYLAESAQSPDCDCWPATSSTDEPGDDLAACADDFFDPIIQRADRLAARHKRRYAWLGLTVLVLAAAAALSFGLREINDWDTPALAWVEPVALAVALSLQLWISASRLTARWLTYRGLVERLRSAKHLALVGHREPSHAEARDERGTQPWVASEAWRIWHDWLGRLALHGDPQPNADAHRRIETWLRDQLRHHRDGAVRWARNDKLTKRVAIALAVAAIGLLVVGNIVDASESTDRWLASVALILPVVAGVLSGYAEQQAWREYAARSHRTAGAIERALAELATQRPADEDLRALVKSADRSLRHDLKEWYWSMELSEIRHV